MTIHQRRAGRVVHQDGAGTQGPMGHTIGHTAGIEFAC